MSNYKVIDACDAQFFFFSENVRFFWASAVTSRYQFISGVWLKIVNAAGILWQVRPLFFVITLRPKTKGEKNHYRQKNWSVSVWLNSPYRNRNFKIRHRRVASDTRIICIRLCSKSHISLFVIRITCHGFCTNRRVLSSVL